MSEVNKKTEQVKIINKMNLFYGIIGLIFFSLLGAAGEWKSFLFGWVVVVINFELLKRICSLLFQLYNENKYTKVIYLLMIGKFSLWAVIIGLFLKTHWISPMSFVVGTLTIVLAGLGLGIREIYYARA